MMHLPFPNVSGYQQVEHVLGAQVTKGGFKAMPDAPNRALNHGPHALSHPS